MANYELSNRIYELRIQKGLSQKELGAILGVSNKAVSVSVLSAIIISFSGQYVMFKYSNVIKLVLSVFIIPYFPFIVYG